jgi:hypothetical protein
LRLALNLLWVQVALAAPPAQVEAVMKAMVAAGAPGIFSEASQKAANCREPARAYHAALHEITTSRNYHALKETELRQEPAATAAVVGTLEAGKQIRSSHLARTPAPVSRRGSSSLPLARERNVAPGRSGRTPAAGCTSAA